VLCAASPSSGPPYIALHALGGSADDVSRRGVSEKKFARAVLVWSPVRWCIEVYSYQLGYRPERRAGGGRYSLRVSSGAGRRYRPRSRGGPLMPNDQTRHHTMDDRSSSRVSCSRLPASTLAPLASDLRSAFLFGCLFSLACFCAFAGR
jgi:hypothetical protein